MPLLAKEGLLDPKAETWEAAAYNTGGTSAILLRDPSDAKTAARVTAVLEAARKNPAYGIGRVFNHQEVLARGGRPDALFMLDPAPGWRFATGTAKLIAEIPGTGAHGQMPDHPELRAAFMVSGPGIAQHKDLGVIDMRQIAPTLARLLQVKLPRAKLAPLNLR